MGLGEFSQSARAATTCGHADGDVFFIVIEWPGIDGEIHYESGRFCHDCGASFATKIPPDVGPITIRIFDWRGPDVMIGIQPPPGPAAQEAHAA